MHGLSFFNNKILLIQNHSGIHKKTIFNSSRAKHALAFTTAKFGAFFSYIQVYVQYKPSVPPSNLLCYGKYAAAAATMLTREMSDMQRRLCRLCRNYRIKLHPTTVCVRVRHWRRRRRRRRRPRQHRTASSIT